MGIQSGLYILGFLLYIHDQNVCVYTYIYIERDRYIKPHKHKMESFFPLKHELL